MDARVKAGVSIWGPIVESNSKRQLPAVCRLIAIISFPAV